MKTYIKGSYRRKIYSSGNYIIGLFKVRETNDETMKEYINKTVTFTGYFYELVIDDMLNRKKVLRLIHDGQMTVLHKGSYAECITTAKDFLMLLN